MAYSQTDLECLLVEKNSLSLVCAAKVRVLKLQDADHVRDADQTNATRAQQATYLMNKQAKEEVLSVDLNRNLE